MMYFYKTLIRQIRYLYYIYLIFDLKTCAEMPQIKTYKRDKLKNFKEKYL